MKRLTALLLLAVAVAGCKRNPVERLTNPYPDGAVPQSSGIYVIYDDELNTGGGVAFIPGGQNQSIDFRDRSSPRTSVNQVRYTWTGGPVFSDETSPPGFQQLFAGFNLLVPVTREELPTTQGKDLSQNGYTKLKMRVRGRLALNNRLRVEGPDDGTGGDTAVMTELTAAQLSEDWQDLELAVPAIHFSGVKIYMTVSIQYEQPPRTTQPGEGGTVYFDDIRYER